MKQQTSQQSPGPTQVARIARLANSGSNREAWNAANALYSKYPTDPTANFVIALILRENSQIGDALPFAEAAVEFAPDDARILVFLGKLYIDLKMVEFASDVVH
jgi:predicted Zn-dependent protease